MKRELSRCHLRWVPDRAYDQLYAGPGKRVVEGSLEDCALDDPIDAPHSREADASAQSDPDPARLNPLRDEPPAAVINAVRRFGFVGLVTCALGSGVLRWWRSHTH